ncbi:iron oxidase oxidoreductase [Sulfurovum sp. TSL1]|uniref:iron oxidase oxidoreductase n=1 Tax=Sulfurovum sp. TSL1 TaxID=2826994 RepID=UPI001CC35CCA|nr:iron oxidase oxidoreductase [Sulfurovum sp. TSL1]GIT97533.1 hypothetical protein TSL1_03540 [Sulfurovum sp. TSL1]
MKTSRRDFFRFMSALGLVSFFTTPLNAKTAKNIVKYQSTPKDGDSCKTCIHFIPETNECKTVEGSVDPNGWCNIYSRDPQYKEVKAEDDNQTNDTDNAT